MIKKLNLTAFVISDVYVVYSVCQAFAHQPIDSGLALWALGLGILSGSLYFALDLGERVRNDEHAQRFLEEGRKRLATTDRSSMDPGTPTKASTKGRQE